jgi:predicted amidophosphoribosyltransferase
MPTVAELAGLLQTSMRNPARPGPGICPICRGFPNDGFTEDRGCGFNPNHLDAVAPISYAPSREQLHTALRDYKDSFYPKVRALFQVRLASVLWLFLDQHEVCVAKAAKGSAPRFDVVCTVPSKTRQRDSERPALRTLVGQTCQHTAERYERLLMPTDQGSSEREYDPARYEATRKLDGEHVLLIDDTWTTGSAAQSAGYALKQAGAASVGFVAIGRYITTDFADHGERLAAIPLPFSWETCAVH